MNQYEVPAYITDELPELKNSFSTLTASAGIIKSIQCLCDYTKNKVQQHELPKVKKCLIIMENIYNRGNTIVKDAVENVFLFSFSSILNVSSRQEKQQLQALMPVCLYTAYVQQMYKSGI